MPWLKCICVVKWLGVVCLLAELGQSATVNYCSGLLGWVVECLVHEAAWLGSRMLFLPSWCVEAGYSLFDVYSFFSGPCMLTAWKLVSFILIYCFHHHVCTMHQQYQSTFVLFQTDAHNYKIIRILKQLKFRLAPTCFGSCRNHHQGAISCLAKTINMVLYARRYWCDQWHVGIPACCARSSFLHHVQHTCTTGWYADMSLITSVMTNT